MTMPDPQAALSRGQAALTAAGFSVTSGRKLDPSGDRLIELEHGLLHVEIGLDRGELYLTLRAPSGGLVRGPEEW